jgi:hypothetical protein
MLYGAMVGGKVRLKKPQNDILDVQGLRVLKQSTMSFAIPLL